MFNKNRIMFLDGGMGTLLAEKGWKPPMLPEEMNIEKPQIVKGIHRAYIEAGADIIETNTFGGSSLKLAHRGLEARTEEINEKGARIAREAAGNGDVLVAGCAGPLGELLEPSGKLTFKEALEAFKPQFKGLIAGGADFILIETILDIREAKAAVAALKEIDGSFPFVLSFTFDQFTPPGKRRTITGTPPEVAARWARAVGAKAVGANCGVGPGAYIETVKILREFSGLPVFVYANAGLPKDEEKWEPEEYARIGKQLAEAGAAVIGGCCRTTPEHIRALSNALKDISPLPRANISGTAFASRSRLISTGNELLIIGERINASRAALRDELSRGEWSGVRQEAQEQTEAGADLLDVNVGLAGADQAALMRKAVSIVEGISDLPLSLDSDRFDILEEGLRACSGIPLLNSVTAKKDALSAGISLAKKYGAVLAVLAIDESGIPETADERGKLAERVMKTADEHGFPRENIILDALCMAVGADVKAPTTTLKTLQSISSCSVSSMLGLSNVSHGMPARPLINRTWLAMAMGCGLSCAILNPLDTLLMDTVAAGNLLRGGDAQKFIENAPAVSSQIVETVKKKTYSNSESLNIGEKFMALAEAIIQGDTDKAPKLSLQLDDIFEPAEIINNAVIPALERVGKLYDEGVYFLPQLIASANAAQSVCDGELKRIAVSGGKERGVIVLATVEGDLHDLGKNVVATMLRSNGYKVFDLGKNVPYSEISECITRENAQVVGLSALMTGTMQVMQEDTERLKADFPNVIVTIGGASVSDEFCKKIGADGYAPDAPSAVRLIDRLLR